ncbi:type II toxin-antitoxin system death-on-curing family toxin [Lelliottia sp. V89_10]|uniref:type II toxin-antitoxin system death-on-curing family toxin n=1 Tax=Lelliottia wanjuensis TaxID=3050585 RepID=UPI00249DCEC3|nr:MULTISPECIES: type II toxin-antitoxin system death-on-curing family toxin [unclassified Lelliottia]MDI3360310.1 type II toxin-antitoxin system death-on-curing family toxin [Lelliottia sp. V89_13]MDK9549464.1 type II toxin-antitoxin system death-on-curing family toxin [Lelliottia sp. V89_5]MDK9596121.1 type II toxin-antitoxin system death-on-curing family toxin [Lelliottia sp. V89_10]
MIFSLNEAIIMRIHDRMIELYGGLPGIPDAERVGAIISRVEQAAYYSDPVPDVFEMAALYWVAIARGHIFNDANKRTALASTLFYLLRNNIQIRNHPEDQARLVDLTLEAATGDRDVAYLAAQLRTFVAF